MLTIYHYNKCSKSRAALQFLIDQQINHQVVNYQTEKFTAQTLTNLIELLNIKPIELVRTLEKIWIETYKNKILTDIEIIDAMVLHFNLIERPIVVNKNKAVIAKPIENIDKII